MRCLGLLAIGCLLAACKAETFACAGDDECMLAGEPGLCLSGNCAYPDAACPSGYRYAAGLGNGLAGECVADDVSGGTGDGTGDATTDASASTGASVSAGPSSDDPSLTGPMPSSTTGDVDPTDPMTSGPISLTGLDTGADVISDSMTITEPTTGMVACTELECVSCLMCELQANGQCSKLLNSCVLLDGCSENLTCIESCAVGGVCLENCCDGISQEAADLLLQIYSCEVEACASPCGDLGDPTCVPSP